jgi:nucleoside phosphorylase
MRIGLVAEVKWEVREVCRQLNLTLRDARDEIWGADLNGHAIRLCLSGMVPAVAKDRTSRFLDSEKLDLMLCSGLAGALQADIRVGDLIVQSEDPQLVELAESALRKRDIPYRVGPLVTTATPVLTPAARRDLATRSGAVAVDMESQTIAALCRERGIPCLAIKGVSDGFDDDLSPILGGVEIIHIPSIALKVLLRPWTWPLAARLAWHSYVAANRLGRGVWAVLNRVSEPVVS